MPQLDFSMFFGQSFLFFLQFLFFSFIYEDFFIIIISTLRLRKKIISLLTISSKNHLVF